jgi:hypothetical protein
MPAMRQDGSTSGPAPLVRGGSRRITTMRFRPANISVINRRDSHAAIHGVLGVFHPVPAFRVREEGRTGDLLNSGVDRSLHISRQASIERAPLPSLPRFQGRTDTPPR